MTKAKTNALDALRTLIAERQQYEQWIASLEAKRESTAEHVFDRVRADYKTRLERVVSDIRGHAEELQLSISTLSSRLVEVAREEDTRREGLQEAELRAAVGEYEPDQWDQLRTDAEKSLEKIGADRASLDSQLGELRAIQKLSEVGTPSLGAQDTAATTSHRPTTPAAAPPSLRPTPARDAAPAAPVQGSPTVSATRPQNSPPAATATPSTESPKQPIEPTPVDRPVNEAPAAPSTASQTSHGGGGGEPAPRDQGRLPLEPVAAQPASAQQVAPAKPAASSSVPTPSTSNQRVRTARTPPAGIRSKSEAARPDNMKTLKCPECGTANYPTEWYCERCGGELATM